MGLEDVVVNSDAVFQLEICGAAVINFDHLTLDGGTTLAGSLEVELVDGFVPQVGDTFSLLTLLPEVNLQGDFSNILLPEPATGLWDGSGLLANVTLLVTSSEVGLKGDFNDDDIVDAADYTVWQDNLSLDASVLSGNESGEATVVQADYDLWKTHVGESVTSGSEVDPVSEPTTLLLALAAVPLRMRCR